MHFIHTEGDDELKESCLQVCVSVMLYTSSVHYCEAQHWHCWLVGDDVVVMMCGCVATRGEVVGYGRVDVLGCMQV